MKDPRAPHLPSTHYLWIDALRGFAALSVLFYHLTVLGGLAVPMQFPLGWAHFGFWGVDLFFAISGAVMVLSTERLRARYGVGWRSEFVRRRLLRIVPLYVFTCVAFVLLVDPAILKREDVAWNLLSHALFLHNLFPSLHGALNGPSWSLGVEMQFYALVLLTAPWMLRTHWLNLLLCAVGFSLLWRLAIWYGHVLPAAGEPEPSVFFLATQLPGVLLSFAGGAVAARWVLAAPGSASRQALVWAALSALVLWTLACLSVLELQDGYWLRLPGLIGVFSLVVLASALCVWTALRLPSPGAVLTRPLRWLGDISYGLYLWHLGVILLLRETWVDSPGMRAAVVVVISVGLASASWRWLERPLIQRARPAPVADGAPA